MITTNAEDPVMDLASSRTTILETDIKLEGTCLIHNSRPTMELHSSKQEVIGVILLETTHSTGRGRPFNRYQNQFCNRIDDNDYRNGSTGAPSRGNWQNIGSNPRSPSGRRRDPQQNRQYQPSLSSTPDNSVLRRSNSQESGGFVPCEQRFPRTNDQSGSHAVRFTTTDDSINALSDLCPLN